MVPISDNDRYIGTSWRKKFCETANFTKWDLWDKRIDEVKHWRCVLEHVSVTMRYCCYCFLLMKFIQDVLKLISLIKDYNVTRVRKLAHLIFTKIVKAWWEEGVNLVQKAGCSVWVFKNEWPRGRDNYFRMNTDLLVTMYGYKVHYLTIIRCFYVKPGWFDLKIIQLSPPKKTQEHVNSRQ